MDDAIVSAIELDTLAACSGDAETYLDRLQTLKCGRQDWPLLAALWLLAGLAVPRPAFMSAWQTLSPVLRKDLLFAMLDLQPGLAVRVLGPDALAGVLGEAEDHMLHLGVARALTLCRIEGAERCLATMLPEAQAVFAPFLAESAAENSERVPRWLLRLSPLARRMAILRYAVSAATAGNGRAFDDALARLERADLKEMESLLERSLERMSAEGVHVVAHRWPYLPGSASFAGRLATALVRSADHALPPDSLIAALDAALSEDVRGALASCSALDPARLSESQNLLRRRLVGSSGPRALAAGRHPRSVGSRLRDTPPAGAEIPFSAAEAAHWSPEQWRLCQTAIREISSSARRAHTLLRLVPVAPPEELRVLGRLAAELDAPAWRRQAAAAVFTRTLALGLNPFPVVKGTDRRDVVAALLAHRLARGRLEALGHRCWSRLDHLQILSLYRLAFDGTANVRDAAQRSGLLEPVSRAIVRLPASLAVVVAIQFIERFNRDEALTAEQLGNLMEIADTAVPQRQALLQVGALAFWLRGDERSGARCRAEAEACKQQTANVSIARFLEAVDVPRGSPPDAGSRRAAAAMTMLEADDPNASEQVAGCLADLEGMDRTRFVAHLIVQGQAAHVMLALDSGVGYS